jgi:hypothetical protein
MEYNGLIDAVNSVGRAKLGMRSLPMRVYVDLQDERENIEVFINKQGPCMQQHVFYLY